MERASAIRACLSAICLMAAAGAQAQPKFIQTSNASDLTADGNSTFGFILDANVNGQLQRFIRGSGHTLMGPAVPSIDGGLRVSGNGQFFSAGLYNGLFGAQNPAFGNYGNSGHGHFIQHRFSVASNTWSNGGAFPNVAGVGAAKCDSTINTPYGISGDGRFVTGGAWYGAYGSTSCSTRGFVYDANDGSVRILPMVGTGCQAFSQGERISTNGLVVMGSDSHTSPDAIICNARCITVWERSSTSSEFLASGRTVLDGWGAGGLSAGAMTRDGSQVAASMSTGQAVASGLSERNLYKYVKNTGTGAWDRINLGRCADREAPCVCMNPYAISDDGGTIVGQARYGTDCSFFGGALRPFIWRASINEGVPMDLADYLQSINGGQPFPPTGSIGIGQSISADGNAIIGSWSPPNAPNCPPNTGLQPLPQAGILYLDGSAIPCEPPRVVGGPYSRVQVEYTQFGIVGNVFASGSYPMTQQWQKETPTNSGNWMNISDSCGNFSTVTPWTYEGTNSQQLRINMLAPAADRDGRYRCVLTNPCGTTISPPADFSVLAGACCYVPAGSTEIFCSVEMQSRCVGSPVISFYFGGVYLGDNTVCGPTSCGEVSGACCSGLGGGSANCTIDIASHCVLAASSGGAGGTFAGAGTTCVPSNCNLVSGACCYSQSDTSDVICTVEVQSTCTNMSASGLKGTYIGNGTTCSPTACQSVAGACCYAPSAGSDLICRVQTEARCMAPLPIPSNTFPGLAGIYVGAGSTCLPLNQQCGFVAGACCYSLDDTSSAICTVQLQDRCTRAKNNSGLGGSYRGDGTTCVPTSCTNVTGACCYSTFQDPTVLLCTIQPQSRCTSRFNAGGLFGTYLGNGSACTPTACAASVGACCYVPPNSNGCQICSLQPGAAGASLRCTDPVNGGLGGTFTGLNTTCTSPGACTTNAGACCLGTFCFSSCQSDCVNNQGGTFQGLGTACTPTDPCAPPTTGACCSGTTCGVTTQAACSGPNTRFAGLNTACNAVGNNTNPCCRADYNQAGGVSVQDIFDFLNGYFANNPQADFNGGGTTVQDIFDFLGAYFAGC